MAPARLQCLLSALWRRQSQSYLQFPAFQLNIYLASSPAGRDFPQPSLVRQVAYHCDSSLTPVWSIEEANWQRGLALRMFSQKWKSFSSTTQPTAPSVDADVATRPGQHQTPITDSMWQVRKDRNLEGPAQQILLTKTPKDSFTEVVYNFASDLTLRETYRNPWGYVRFGRVLEDLDSLAGTVATKHCEDEDKTTRPLILVTASVDKISMRRALRLDVDMKLRGAATWVGRSSMEISIFVIQQDPSDPLGDPVALDARFTFVARDSKTNRAAPINRLRPETADEKQLFAEGVARDLQRKALRAKGAAPAGVASSLADGRSPADISNARLRQLLEDSRLMLEMPALADRDAILIRDTRLEFAMICQPQQRNTHGRIFGGFLMRRAFELAFSTCYVFCGSRPVFLEVDHVDFRRPVDIGDLLRFKSGVLYTERECSPPRMHVEVTAIVTQPELRKSEVSNTFYFTFALEPRDLATGVVRRVIPTTEEEARTIINRYDADHMSKL